MNPVACIICEVHEHSNIVLIPYLKMLSNKSEIILITLTMLIPDISCLENIVNQDQLADLDPHCFPQLLENNKNNIEIFVHFTCYTL